MSNLQSRTTAQFEGDCATLGMEVSIHFQTLMSVSASGVIGWWRRQEEKNKSRM